MTDVRAHLQKYQRLVGQLRAAQLICEEFGDSGIVLGSQPTPPPNGQQKDIDLFILGLVHGNEVVGLDVINLFIEKALSSTMLNNRRVAISLGNVTAALKGLRFVEKDLNRVFGTTGSATLEEKIARGLEPMIARSRYLLDIHQTIESTETPFFIFGYDLFNLRFANLLNSSLPIITYKMDERKDEGGLVVTSFATLSGTVSATIELGQKGFNKSQSYMGLELCESALKNCTQPKENLPMLPPYFKVLTYAERVPNTDDSCELIPGFKNFSLVKKGQIIGKNNNGPIICKNDGKTLFPKYGDARRGQAAIVVILEEKTLDQFR